MSSPGNLGYRGAALLCCLAVLFLAPGSARAGLSGSLHDFRSGPWANALGTKWGACGSCHIPHFADPYKIWTRSLSQERYIFDQTKPKLVEYIPGSTIACYDCHDDGAYAAVPTVDADPPQGVWISGHKPQDIAFTDGPPPTGVKTGFYELIDGKMPGIANPAPTDGSPTGGHYWKTEPVGTPDYVLGDKIYCGLCHEPHGIGTSNNEAFFLAETTNGAGSPVTLGTGLKASPNMVNGTHTGTGREMCIACHGNSNVPSAKTFWGINLGDVNHVPPATISEHNSADTTTPCTNCHKHNKITARCDDCHGYPPTTVGTWTPNSTNENYVGGAGAHLAHIKGAGKLATDPDKYAFGCLAGTCHPNNLHNQGGGTVVRANVQVTFKSPANPAGDAWNPNGVFASGVAPAQDACTKLYCHSNGLVENRSDPATIGTGENGPSGVGEYAESSGKVTFYGTTPAKPATWGGSLDCKGCHGKGDPNMLKEVAAGSSSVPVSAPDYLNKAASPVGTFNDTGANSHFIHVYKLPNNSGGTCRCHGTMDSITAPVGHVNRSIEITDCFLSCHLGGYWGDKHGQTAGADNCTNNTLMGCHGKEATYDSPGGRITRPAVFSAPQDNQPKYMQSGHGLPAASKYSSGNNGAGLACESCHLATDRLNTNGALEASYHYERDPMATGYAGAPLATNPYWLKGTYATNPDGLCESCHNGVAAISAKNHTAQKMYEPPANYNPNYDTGSNPPPPVGPWSTFTSNCISCHDPHGEPNEYMIYDGDAEKSVSSYSATMEYSGPVIYKGSRFGVTRAQSDTYGFPPGPIYQNNQTPISMTGHTNGSNFVNGTNTGPCQVCHTLTKYYRRDGSNPGGGHITTLCLDCHKHPTAFAPTGCEGCHNANPLVWGCDGIQGTADDPPNVMGDGVSVSGVGGNGKGAKPYDDGTYGYNVNGHGANGSKIPSLTPNRACTDCHDLNSPSPNKHYDCGDPVNQRVNTRSYFGKPADSRNANTSHLVAGYLAGASNSQAKQIGFDDYCYNTCHLTDGQVDMRHASAPGGLSDKIMEFGVLPPTGTAATTDNPKQDRGANNVWTPWTIEDITTTVAASPPGTHYNGVCVSCHDPHGTSTLQKTRLTNKMVIRNWKGTSMATFCQSNCHISP